MKARVSSGSSGPVLDLRRNDDTLDFRSVRRPGNGLGPGQMRQNCSMSSSARSSWMIALRRSSVSHPQPVQAAAGNVSRQIRVGQQHRRRYQRRWTGDPSSYAAAPFSISTTTLQARSRARSASLLNRHAPIIHGERIRQRRRSMRGQYWTGAERVLQERTAVSFTFRSSHWGARAPPRPR